MFRERTYRIDLVLYGLASTILCVLILEGLRVGAGMEELPHVWESRLIALIILVGTWGMCAIVRAVLPVFTGPDGIRAPDGLGRFHDVRWEEITKVSSIVGFLWVRHGKWGKALCFPMFLNDWSGFRGEVMRYASEDNPLRNYLFRR
ncbi:hypothetical protein EON79_06410 [bacterium]|nr:MAG: hypothetical protein EON79_06410 [bacterium]